MTTRAADGEQTPSARPVGDRLRDDVQPLVSVALVVAAAWTVRPLGLHGLGLVQLILLALNAVVLLQRSVPDRYVPERVRSCLMWIGVIAAAAILATDSSSVASAFPFFIAGYAGYRYPVRRAVLYGAATSVAGVTALAVAAVVGHPAVSWPFGLLCGLPVFLGIARRERVVALRNAQIALEQTRRAAASEVREQALAERARIARDIHDVLAHSLSGVNMQLQLADALIDRDRVEEGQVALGRAQAMVREGLTEARKAVYALREETLPLQQSLAAMLDNEPAATQLETTGTVRAVDTGVAQALVRAVQEALTNARKHAPGAPITVRLGFSESDLTVEVVNGPSAQTDPGIGDSGSGMGLSASGSGMGLSASGSGMGLVGMRERVALLGGTVESGPVTSGRDAGGWRIWVRIPT